MLGRRKFVAHHDHNSVTNAHPRMRVALRLLADVKPRRFLEPGNPTGLTGLFTHATPRSTLLYLYSSTLDKLKTLPEYSIYRQSVEAITQHRQKIVESIKPNGFEEWAEKATKLIQDNPGIFNAQAAGPIDAAVYDGWTFITTQQKPKKVRRAEEWDGEIESSGTLEGPRNSAERANQRYLAPKEFITNRNAVPWVPAPILDASQIIELENKIGGGLIEEVIEVAEGELKLIETMAESKVWEELEEKPLPDQWDYFARDRHSSGTQEPPK